MDAGHQALPDDVEALKAALLAARAEVAVARAKASDDQALIAHLKLEIAKLNRHRYGPHAERTARLLDQMELQLEELEACATSDELTAEMAAAKTTTVATFTRQRPARKLWRDNQDASSATIWMRPVSRGGGMIDAARQWRKPRFDLGATIRMRR